MQQDIELSAGAVSRRTFVKGLATVGIAAASQGGLRRADAASVDVPAVGRPQVLNGTAFELRAAASQVNITGRARVAHTLNGSLPAPTLRWREGDVVTVRVSNALADHPASIHWHGIILPANMDGVPGLSFDGIAPGESWTYRIPVRQAGTYWYHSHSAFQEQRGLYGALVLEPREPEPA